MSSKFSDAEKSQRTVYDYRKENDLPKQRVALARAKIKQLEDEGHKITGKFLVEKMGLSQRYAYDLAQQWKLNKLKAKELPKKEVKLKANQRLTPHGILTVRGAITRHEFR